MTYPVVGPVEVEEEAVVQGHLVEEEEVEEDLVHSVYLMKVQAAMMMLSYCSIHQAGPVKTINMEDEEESKDYNYGE